MSIVFSLLTNSLYLITPQGIFDQLVMAVGWLFFMGAITFILYRRSKLSLKFSKKHKRKFLFLLISVPFATLFFGIRLPLSGALPPPGFPIDPQGQVVMILSALPWVIGAGVLGVFSGSLLAFGCGFLLMAWGTHNIFTALELSFAALVFGACMHQRYRTPFFRALRHPIVAGGILSLFYPILYLYGATQSISGSLVVRLDYAITHVNDAWLAFAGSFLLACVFAEIYYLVFPKSWGNNASLQPSPAEQSLEGRYLFTLGPIVIILALILLVLSWNEAEKTARQMIEGRLSSIAQLTIDGIPYFMETGQTLMLYLTDDERWLNRDDNFLQNVLKENLRKVPFFTQLYLLDAKGLSIAGYPDTEYNLGFVPQEEQYGILRAMDGVLIQTYSATPEAGDKAAQISFIAAILDNTGVVRGILVGRSKLAINPFFEPIVNSLNTLTQENGQGILLDEANRILYHPLPGLLMTQYTGKVFTEQQLYDEMGSDGTRRLAYYKKSPGRPWSVVLTVPAQVVQQKAIQIALPFSGMVLFLSFFAAFFFHLSMRKTAGSLHLLTERAVRITQGELEQPVQIHGDDEVGRLGHSFELMRLGLKAKLEEQRQMLWVSQGVASSLDLTQSTMPVLETIVIGGASSARIVLSSEALPELAGASQALVNFAFGPKTHQYGYLDDQLLALSQTQERVVITNPFRPHLLNYPPNATIPESILAVPLRHENLFYGALWLAFDQPHSFSEDEVRFIIMLAGQAALATANSRYYLNAEVRRQRLEAILNSSPDPILVTDQSGNLLLANPASWQALGWGATWKEGDRIDGMITNLDLLELLKTTSNEIKSQEIALANGRVYSATISTVSAGGKTVGRVCVMRDITYFKDLDKLKSDFVSTVSHDLRSPLNLMRGYATMLEMVGDLNEQQVGYIRKILSSVESMSKLVSNLLDLGRIEAGVGLQLELISTREVIERVVSGLQMQAAQKRQQLKLDLDDQSIPLIQADQALFQQALHNLVDNAIKFTEPDGKILVKGYVRNDRLIIEILDNGIGIAHVDQARIFEKFYRVSQVGGKPSTGAGLGLAIVKSIVERHGGIVWVDSQLGKGSRFSIAMPQKQN